MTQAAESSISSSPPWPIRHVLGMKVDLATADDAIRVMIAKAKTGEAGYCCVTNVHTCMVGYDDPAYQKTVNDSDIALPDSTILRRATEFRYGINAPVVEKGADLMIALCAAAERENVPVALVGGRDEETLRILKERMLEKFPALRIVYDYSPPFRPATEEEELALAKALRDSGAQVIICGLGCPKQERWMGRFKPLVNAMMIGVGAAFDFNSGAVKPSPTWVHRIGAEWLWRLVSEPRRLWRRYFTTSPRFVRLLIIDKLTRSA